MPYASIEDALYDPQSIVTVAIDHENGLGQAMMMVLAGRTSIGEVLETVPVDFRL